MVQINFLAFNTTGSAITLQTFLADPSQTSVATADRMYNSSLAAGSFTAGPVTQWLTEGWSYWAQASAAAGLNLFPLPTVFPSPLYSGAINVTPLVVKSVPTVETLLYQNNTPESYTHQVATSFVHNSSAGTLTYTTKLKRSTDPASITVNVQSLAAGAQASWAAGASPTLFPGDAIYHLASGAGINAGATFVDRPIRGLEPFRPLGLHA